MIILPEFRLIADIASRKDMESFMIALIAVLYFYYLIGGVGPRATSLDVPMPRGILLSIIAILIFTALSCWLIRLIRWELAVYDPQQLIRRST